MSFLTYEEKFNLKAGKAVDTSSRAQNVSGTQKSSASIKTESKFTQKRRRRDKYSCGKCDGCLRKEDCKRCQFCRDKPKYGGTNRLRQKCTEMVCRNKARVKRSQLQEEGNAKLKRVRQNRRGRGAKNTIGQDVSEEDIHLLEQADAAEEQEK